MSSYKEYRSVTEFPLHTDKLGKEELEQVYQDLRKEYRSLTNSRGQLVRRQRQAKQKLEQLHTVKGEVEKLRNALAHSMQVQGKITDQRDSLLGEVDSLVSQLNATTQILTEFESVYEEVKDHKGGFAFIRLLKAAKKLLTTDIGELMPERKAIPEPEEWTKTDPASINRQLLDE